MSLIVMATGGTGGHIYPAVAVSRELLARGHEAVLLGQRGGMEERVAAEQGLPFQGVNAGKLARSGQGRPDPRELLRAARGVAEARAFLRDARPGAVVGFGGFASLPGVLAAQTLGIPTVLHEQNARLGLTQRLAAGRARAVGTAYPHVLGLPEGKATLVGMPVREERLPRAEALAQLGLQDGPLTLLVMGGSQGSLALNHAVPDILREIFGPEGRAPEGPVQVLHATGPRWLAEVAPRVADLPWYKPVGYTNAVAAWSAADLAITRAGTGTLAEAAFHGVPLVMVPLPESAENHQYHNAVSVQEAGAGRVVEQEQLRGALGAAVLECAAAGTRAAMRKAAFLRSPVGAASRFADLVERHLR
ncbi:undecaprenyldiphospho-muramoylpentapeptide beta-N-acetylglucosaminyltransferase [Deinococcus geothermalis]|uniref:UDP-N-acetylglucosamine--N-acetylmuramyl-(pentapeptide) pyrophosphoryl-undecaprenol N-acetylglucosamine transferase n=1 Tax=Deinococcus geothermalis (strain DSM 11300 / CIP 105573 / AG-3a) TaxID=319795 RepID=MURG_DEIGD|nr:undecaprenyldiphospho-muramoylpentapeptide beta-N-acetylglucosaminyltransferase [Deinococcus geothermalis]Q1IXV9.1 RecName: Full=UDP-N-acetylglucosamine--N-acetylmuramyl-(pentapeptide) pyrophosphoryl-undecaprenol N-acetylglucosamine transferase; AltName: Full=Undecaprenyl-PP-MurNAc-pentapeptide-UDPGlcNAc GlcNAc transferase [Deinococcus geothermalis DSM 11300]ABF45925.1 UDP-N-acetylglucosamine--N-acetylmuramyl-(pentapeptide) pyrophosphoryl-undecaprenol N-acetylglucosamine transferase [Deinococc